MILVNPARYDINKYQITKANKLGTNWYKEIMRQRPMQSHTISVSGGAEKVLIYFLWGISTSRAQCSIPI
ncbi:MAG: hypothetical protein WKG06_32365 [Segetibacter sp.]